MGTEQDKVARFILSVIHGDIVGKKLSLISRKRFIENYFHIAHTFYFCIVRSCSSVGKAMDPEQASRMTRMLSAIHADICEKTLPPVGEGKREAFVKHYLDLMFAQTHPTHTFIRISMDFWRGGEWSAEGVVTNEFFDYLEKNNPRVYLGEVNGKHSDVNALFAKLIDESNTDYFKVEANRGKFPGGLDGLFEEWEEEKEEDEAWADKEFPAEKRARTEKHDE